MTLGNDMVDYRAMLDRAGVHREASNEGLQGIITELSLLKSVKPTISSVSEVITSHCSEFIMKSKRELDNARRQMQNTRNKFSNQ